MVESLFYLEISPTTLGTKKTHDWIAVVLEYKHLLLSLGQSRNYKLVPLVGGVINLINWYNYNKP